MNYCIVAFAIIIIISTIQWIIDGRKNFKGPQIEEEALKNAALYGTAISAEGETAGPVVTNERSEGDGNGYGEKKAV